MSTIVEGACRQCGSTNVGGELSFRAERRRADGTWMAGVNADIRSLCPPCFGWVDSLMTAASGHAGSSVGVLGIPMAGRVVRPNDRHCLYCHCEFTDESYTIDLVTLQREYVRSSLWRHVGSLKQQRLCRQCHAWWLTTLVDPSAVRGTSIRAADGPFGTWRTTYAFDAATISLGPREHDVVEAVVTGAGRASAILDAPSLPHFPSDGTAVLFVGAGKLNRAASIMRRVPEPARSFCVVVARPDYLTDAIEAMRLGAGDLLVVPLSPQQVTGAFDRIGNPGSSARDPATGLRLLSGPTDSRFGYAGQAIRVRPAHSDDLLPTVLLLRRYVHGYDSVGVDDNGAAVAVVYCPPDHVQAVIKRMTLFLGDKVKIELLANAAKTARAA